jgi:hypothetical protein
LIDRCGINQVFLEDDRTRAEPVYRALLRSALEGAPGTWEAIELPLVGSRARLYRRRDPLPARPVQLFIPRLGRTIGGNDP